jgi:heme-degrading monooxygenase HmoA
MYLRFIRLVVREGTEAQFAGFYRERVIPALTAVPGCVFAGLLTPWRSEAHRSLTLWRSARDAHAYEDSGLYHRLLRESTPYLSSGTVWRARSGDPSRDETIAPGEPVERREVPPEGYEIVERSSAERLGGLPSSAFVRVVAVRAAPNRLGEFVALYREHVLPALRATAGCLGVILAEGEGDSNAVLSITIWDREESSTRYEMSGEFERLRRQVEPTLVPIAPWHQADAGTEGGLERSPLEVASYRLVHGSKLADPGEPG